MNPVIIASLIQQVLLPEILAIVRAHHNATGQLPTDAQVIAALGTDTSGNIAIGTAWLAAHPVTPAAPATTGAM
jgi:hypothetical protein